MDGESAPAEDYDTFVPLAKRKAMAFQLFRKALDEGKNDSAALWVRMYDTLVEDGKRPLQAQDASA